MSGLEIGDAFGKNAADLFSIQVNVVYPFYLSLSAAYAFDGLCDCDGCRCCDEHRFTEIECRFDDDAEIYAFARREEASAEAALARSLLHGYDCGAVRCIFQCELLGTVVGGIQCIVNIQSVIFISCEKVFSEPFFGYYVFFMDQTVSAVRHSLYGVAFIAEYADGFPYGGARDAELFGKRFS